MIIVSQDKRLITESLAISIEDIEDREEKKIMTQEYCGKLYLLGVYATEERAKEVLQEIIERYDVLKKNTTYAQGDGGFTFNEHYYYEMPEK